VKTRAPRKSSGTFALPQDQPAHTTRTRHIRTTSTFDLPCLAGLADGDFLRRLTEIEAKSLEARSRGSRTPGTIIFATRSRGEALVLRAGRVKVSARRRSRE